MSTVPTASTHAAGSAVLKPDATQSSHGDSAQINWDSEIQLVSSLAKLQELERQVSTDILL